MVIEQQDGALAVCLFQIAIGRDGAGETTADDDEIVGLACVSGA
jgi:hypothetical protein